MGLQVVPYFQTNPYHSVAWSRTTVSLKAVHRYASSLHRFAENKHRIWNETVSNSKTKVRLRVVAVLLCLPCYIRFNDVIWWSRQVYKKNIVLSFYWLKRYFRFKSKNMSNKPPHIYSYDKIPNFDQAYIRGEGCELSQPMPQIRPNSCENWILNKRWMKKDVIFYHFPLKSQESPLKSHKVL